MSNGSNIIGEYKGTVKNKVLTALLQSYLDNLDYDGMKSILREAGLLELKDIRDADPDGEIDFFIDELATREEANRLAAAGIDA